MIGNRSNKAINYLIFTIFRGFRTLCLLEIPPFMIPGEILHFFGAILQYIISVKILQHYINTDKYLAILIVDSIENARKIHSDYNGQSLSSLENVTCQLFFVKKITSPNGQSPGLFKNIFTELSVSILVPNYLY